MSKNPEGSILTAASGLETGDLEKSIGAIWREVNEGISPAREEAYKLNAYWQLDKQNRHWWSIGMKTGARIDAQVNPPRSESTRNSSVASELTEIGESTDDEAFTMETELHKISLDTEEKLEEWAGRMEEFAKKFQRDTERIIVDYPKNVAILLRITDRSGRLLNYTERIILAYERLRAQNLHPRADEVLSSALTVVATARDLLQAAESQTKNVKAIIGRRESSRLKNYYLYPIVLLYIIAHPYWLSLVYSNLPSWIMTGWEIIFFSFFGAISISVVTINEDIMRDEFDPRHLEKYGYRIMVSPLVTLVIILFLSLVGLSVTSPGGAGPSSLIINLNNPNIPLLVVLSFILGFFSKRSLDILDQIWRRLFGTDS